MQKSILPSFFDNSSIVIVSAMMFFLALFRQETVRIGVGSSPRFLLSERSKHRGHENLLDKYLVWEASYPYLYFRSTSDGRVIVGGEDEKGEAAYLDPIKIKHKTQVHVEKLAGLTGISLGKPDFAWSAAFGITPDGLPMIGPAPGMRRVFVSMGFGGNGITFAKIAADLISAAVLCHQDVDWDLFPV